MIAAFIIGLFIGGFIGLLVGGLAAAAKEGDRVSEEYLTRLRREAFRREYEANLDVPVPPRGDAR